MYIRPHDIDELGASFDFSSEMNDMRKQLGYLDAKKAFSYLLGKIYYFEPDAFRALVKQYGFRTVEQLEELANVLKVERIRVYDDRTFLHALKDAYDVRKEQLSQQNEQMNDKEANGAYEKEWRNAFLRRFVQRRSDNEYRDAITVLDNLAF